MLIRRGVSSEVARRTDVSALLHVNLGKGNIAAPLPLGASSTMLGGQQEMSIESRDETYVTGFVKEGESPPRQPRPGMSINRDVLG